VAAPGWRGTAEVSSKDARVFQRQVLFGPGFNMGCVDLDSEEEQASVVMEEMSPEEQFAQPPSHSLQFACLLALNTQTEDPLSHYQSPTG
jgi:hypothetical protein